MKPIKIVPLGVDRSGYLRVIAWRLLSDLSLLVALAVLASLVGNV